MPTVQAWAWSLRVNPSPGRLDMHPAVLNLQPLVEQRVQPVEVFNPGFDRIGGGQVQVDFHREVRCQLEVLGLSQRGEFEELV